MRVIYDHLLTEDSLDLLTESGDAFISSLVGYAGDIAADGGIVSALSSESGFDLLTENGDALSLGRRNGGTVSATGRARLVLVGRAAVAGKAGAVEAAGQVASHQDDFAPMVFRPRPQRVLRGRCAVAGQTGSATGSGHLTLVGKVAATGAVGAVRGRGDAFDEMALIMALCA
jgi:hypothetical protein